MTNETTLQVGGSLSPGEPSVAQGVACGLANVENPTGAPIQLHMQLVLSCGEGAAAQVFAQPCDIEVPAQSTVSLGLGLTCVEEANIGLGPAGGESSSSVFRPVMNEATELANLNARLIARGAETVDPEELRWSADPQIANVQLPSGETVRVGLSLERAASDREPWVADPVPDFDPEAERWGPEAPAPPEASDLLVTWDASPWRALEADAAEAAESVADARSEFGGGDTYSDDERDNPDGDRRPSDSARPLSDGRGDMAGDGLGPPPGMIWAKGKLAVTPAIDVAITFTARSGEDLTAAPRLADPDTWTVVEAGTSTSADAPSGATFRFWWPAVPLNTELRATPNVWQTESHPHPDYQQPEIESGGGRSRRSSIPGGEDSPVVRTAGGVRPNRSSIPGDEDEPARRTATSSGLLGRIPRPFAFIVGGVALVAVIVFALAGGGSDSAPAREAGSSAVGATVAIGAGGTGTGVASPSATGVIASGPVGQQLQLLAEMFQAAAATTLRRGAIAIGEDGRRAAGAPPIDWDTETAVYVGTDEDNDELYVFVQGPSEVVGGTCGEVDLLLNGQHTGDGVDFCAASATAPGHLSDLIRYEFSADDGWAAVIIATGLPVPVSGEVAVWQYQTEASGAYEAVERFVVATEVPWLPIVSTAGTSDRAIAANVSGPPPPQLAVPSIGGGLGTTTGGSASPDDPAPVIDSVIAPGFYAVTFEGVREGSCGLSPTSPLTNVALEITISRGGDAIYDMSFFDGQTRASGTINTETGVFEGVGGQYSGTLTGDFSKAQEITRTVPTATCIATYTITVLAQ